MQNNLKVQKVQSWSELFPPEAVEEFDLSTPEKRSEYFMQLWDDWAETQIDLSKYKGMDIKFNAFTRYNWYTSSPVRGWCKTNDLKEFWDYQLRGNCIRFACQDTALMFRLSL